MYPDLTSNNSVFPNDLQDDDTPWRVYRQPIRRLWPAPRRSTPSDTCSSYDGMEVQLEHRRSIGTLTGEWFGHACVSSCAQPRCFAGADI
jgi:hypothetical protein